MTNSSGADDDLNLLSERDLNLLQISTILYYLHESNPDNGLVRDKTDPKAPVSIAACGMSLATIPVIVERGVLFRKLLRSQKNDCVIFSNARKVPSRTPLVTKDFSTISWTSKRVAEFGSASFPPSTRHFSSRG